VKIVRRFALIALILLILTLSAGCAAQSGNQAPEPNKPGVAENGAKRFQIIQEEGETKNIGGFTVIKDTQTGREYLVITSLNGSVTAIDIK